MAKYRIIRAFNDATNNNKPVTLEDRFYECDEKRAKVLKGKNKYKRAYIRDLNALEREELEREENSRKKKDEVKEDAPKKRGLSLD